MMHIFLLWKGRGKVGVAISGLFFEVVRIDSVFVVSVLWCLWSGCLWLGWVLAMN